MSRTAILKSILAGTAAALVASAANAESFNIPAGDLSAALDAYSAQTGISLMVSSDAVRGLRTHGVKGDLNANDALSRILTGTGFTTRRYSTDSVALIRDGGQQSEAVFTTPMQLAQAAPARASVETVTVTSSKLGGADVQSIPISITALSQEQLTSRQVAGGPDLVKEVPNLTFSKTNFTGYNIQIRGIGTQAISVTTDPAVAVAFNDIPFIRNHFFEQEFYDVGQVEVLRGPQGTLYGRNATAGVVNVISAKPTDQFEAMGSADIGNYKNRRFEGMVNIPVVDDRLDIRVAGEWTKRDGYSFNTITDSPIDGRDLWSGRLSIGLKPVEGLRINFVWEHFQENDDRLRSSKQLCKTAPIPAFIGGVAVPPPNQDFGSGIAQFQNPANYLSQGCLPTSLYSADAFEVPNGYTLPYVTAAKATGHIDLSVDPYASTTQSTNLRDIESTIDPRYRAKNDTLELNADYDVAPSLTFTSQTGFNQDALWSSEDYNRFNTSAGIFTPSQVGAGIRNATEVSADGTFCDPQLGCANRLVAEDLSEEHAWQLSQEFRLVSSFAGPLNFSFGGNFLHYETEENYYVFINALTLYTLSSYLPDGTDVPYVPGVTDNRQCLTTVSTPYGYQYPDPRHNASEPLFGQCNYIDPNPITSLNDRGHNYFLSQNPYVLDSYAGFGEVYYNVRSDLKLTGGLRWTDDQKHFTDIPSEVITNGYGYGSIGVVNQKWEEFTGRFAANWSPKLDFTDQTLIYSSFAHGYKAGGANPPGAALLTLTAGDVIQPQHPLTFKPEFIDAYELGTKNTLLDGALTLNADVFYYNYKDYQISEIVDRTAINLNFNATVRGAELETSYEPVPGLKFGFAGGYEDTRVGNGQSTIDLIDRTAGNPDWITVKPSVTQASNCILPVYVVAQLIPIPAALENGSPMTEACGNAYNLHLDPVTQLPYVPNPTVRSTTGNVHDLVPITGYAGYDPTNPAINNGQGFSKDVSGNQLPNAPHFTASFTADYSLPVTDEWAATLHGDFYWQSESFARILNDEPYDRLQGYTNVNLALILTSQEGWQVIGYVKNVFDKTAITGDFLNSDDSGLTTNIFLTDPRLFGVRVTKNF